MAIVEFSEYSFRYAGSERYALRDINLEIGKGEFVVISGPSGCGKTTLLRSMNGLIPHFYPGDVKGDVRVCGMRVVDHETYELARCVGLVFQDPESQMLTLSVEREIAFGLRYMGLPRDEIWERVEWALEALGIEGLRFKPPSELSGGEQQKVAIASLMVMRPQILALDEPLSNLDPMSSMSIVKLLKEIHEKFGATIIIAEHRLDLLAPMATRLVLMNDGRIVEDDEPRAVLAKDTASKIGVGVPQVVRIWKTLRERGLLEDGLKPPLTVSELVSMLR